MERLIGRDPRWQDEVSVPFSPLPLGQVSPSGRSELPTSTPRSLARDGLPFDEEVAVADRRGPVHRLSQRVQLLGNSERGGMGKADLSRESFCNTSQRLHDGSSLVSPG